MYICQVGLIVLTDQFSSTRIHQFSRKIHCKIKIKLTLFV
jgi:hypothetical protein